LQDAADLPIHLLAIKTLLLQLGLRRH